MEATHQQILEAFEFRHASKEFDPERKISEDDFRVILESGRLSPSSFGFEPWKFLVVQNPEIREKIRSVSWGAQGQAPTASHFVLILARTSKTLQYNSEYIQNLMKNVHQMPDEIIERLTGTYRDFHEEHFGGNDRAFFDWACKQTYIALANMMTTAALMKIDSCPIEGFDREKVHGILKEAGVLNEEEFGLAVICAFGYRAHEPRPKTRQAMETVVDWVR